MKQKTIEAINEIQGHIQALALIASRYGEGEAAVLYDFEGRLLSALLRADDEPKPPRNINAELAANYADLQAKVANGEMQPPACCGRVIVHAETCPVRLRTRASIERDRERLTAAYYAGVHGVMPLVPSS